MKINPVYKKELKISVRTIKLSLILFAFNAILTLLGLLAFYIIFGTRSIYNQESYSMILQLYMIISVIEVGLVLFIVPALTAGSIAGERERQTLEILLTTKLKPVQIIFGKLESSISTLILVVVSSLPVMAIVFSIGGIKYVHLIQLVFMVVVTAVFIGSIGLFFSTVFKKTITATVFTYGAVLFLTLGLLIGLLVTSGILYVNHETNDVGPLIYILFLNPCVTLVSMLTKQYGSETYLGDFLRGFGGEYAVTEHWFLLSVVSQLAVAGFFLYFSVKMLNPLKGSRKGKKQKKLQEKKEAAISIKEE